MVMLNDNPSGIFKTIWDAPRKATRIPGEFYRGRIRPYLARDIKAWNKVGRISKKTPFIGRVGGAAFTGLFIGASILSAESLPKGLIAGGAEGVSMIGGAIGAVIGSAIPIPGSSFVLGTLGYIGTSMLTEKGRKIKEAPKFEDVYMNRRALTMRQASMMHLAKTSRAAFGNEASTMHLR